MTINNQQQNNGVNHMQNMATISDLVLQSISTVVPYLLMRENTNLKIDPIYLLLVPFVVKLLHIWWNVLYIWYFKKPEYRIDYYVISITEYQNTGNSTREEKNEAYLGVSYYLQKHSDDIFEWRCEKTERIDKSNNDSYDERDEDESYDMPIYSPNRTNSEDGSSDQWRDIPKHNAIEYRISNKNKQVAGGEKKSVVLDMEQFIIELKGQDKKEIDEFITKSIKERDAYITNQEKPVYKLFDQSGSRWDINDIPVHKTFENIFLSDHIINPLISSIDTFMNSKEFYRVNGIPYKKGYIFYGDPGTGKTSTIFALAKKMQTCIYKVHLNNSNYRNDFISSIRRIKEGSIVVFEDIDTASGVEKRSGADDDYDNSFGPSIDKQIFELKQLDDLTEDDLKTLSYIKESYTFNEQKEFLEKLRKTYKDQLSEYREKKRTAEAVKSVNAKENDKNTENDISKIFMTAKKGMDREKLGMLLDVLDGYTYLNGCVVIMTTNHLEVLDKALYRPGRIDEKYKFDYLDEPTFIKIINHYYPTTSDKDIFNPILATFKIPTKVTSAYLINTIILPHIQNPKWVAVWITQGCETNYNKAILSITTKQD